MRQALLPSVGATPRQCRAFTGSAVRGRCLRLQVCAAKRKGKTSFRRNNTEPQSLRQLNEDLNKVNKTMNTPEVDPVNEEFVIFVRDAVESKLPWSPLSIVKGSAAAKYLVQYCQTEWGRKLFQKTLIKNIAQSVYVQKEDIFRTLRKANPALKMTPAKNFQFAMKIRDKSAPDAWRLAENLTIFPPEAEAKETVLDTIKKFLSPEALQAAAAQISSTPANASIDRTSG